MFQFSALLLSLSQYNTDRKTEKVYRYKSVVLVEQMECYVIDSKFCKVLVVVVTCITNVHYNINLMCVYLHNYFTLQYHEHSLSFKDTVCVQAHARNTCSSSSKSNLCIKYSTCTRFVSGISQFTYKSATISGATLKSSFIISSILLLRSGSTSSTF